MVLESPFTLLAVVIFPYVPITISFEDFPIELWIENTLFSSFFDRSTFINGKITDGDTKV